MPESFSNFASHSASGPPTTWGEILSALSFALDITEGARPGHSLRACLLGMRLGKQIGLSDPALASLYYALLLKDIGCSSNSARMAEAFAADDRVVKHRFKFIDREKLGKPNREALSFVWNNVAPQAGIFDRFRQVYRMIRAPGDLTAEMVEARCERGAITLHKLGMNDEICAAVYSLDEHWNGKGLPDHLAGEEIPLLGRICAVAQHLDLFCTESGPASAMSLLAERSGTWYDPDVVRAAESLAREGVLWRECEAGSDPAALQAAVLALDRGADTALTTHDLDLICSGFADVIDAKSPFAYRHAVASAEAAVLIGRALGLAPERVDVVRRAALLHDIGVLGIPNTILDKTTPLTREEWTVIEAHPNVSCEILSRVRAFGEIATLARQHHEKLDGSGYPLHLTQEQLSMESRIVTAADVFTASMESRPYRPDLTPAEIQRQLEQNTPHKLDPACTEAIVGMLDQLASLPVEDIPASSAELEDEMAMVDPPPFRPGFQKR